VTCKREGRGNLRLELTHSPVSSSFTAKKKRWLESQRQLTNLIYPPIDSPCEYERNNLNSLDARPFPSVVLVVAPAVTVDEASSLVWYVVPLVGLGANPSG